jgi:hypothetical protein
MTCCFSCVNDEIDRNLYAPTETNNCQFLLVGVTPNGSDCTSPSVYALVFNIPSVRLAVGHRQSTLANMPAFDPVRDAVMNSPTVPSPGASLNFARPGTASSPTPILTNRHPGNNFSSPSPVISPSRERRATDLASLLNAESVDPLFTPSAPPPAVRRTSLAHILQPVDDDEKLGALAPPIRRNDSLPQADTSPSRLNGKRPETPSSSCESCITLFSMPSTKPILQFPKCPLKDRCLHICGE